MGGRNRIPDTGPTGSATHRRTARVLRRERSIERRGEGADPPPLRSAAGQDDQLRHGSHAPASLGSDHWCDPRLPIDTRQQRLDVRHDGLDLDDQQRAVDGMPGQHVDRSAFAEVIEGRLRARPPSRSPRGSRRPGRPGRHAPHRAVDRAPRRSRRRGPRGEPRALRRSAGSCGPSGARPHRSRLARSMPARHGPDGPAAPASTPDGVAAPASPARAGRRPSAEHGGRRLSGT